MAASNLRYQVRYQVERLRERVKGLDVIRGASVDQLGLDPNVANFYRNSGDSDLFRVLSTLSITSTDSVVDLGCGKGGALLVLTRFPFARVVGVELSASLCAVADRNLRRRGVGNATVVQANAADFDDYQGITYVYLFNPFPATVMRFALAHLESSLDSEPRPCTIIYKNPVGHDEVVRSGRFQYMADYPSTLSPHHLPFRVYTSAPGA